MSTKTQTQMKKHGERVASTKRVKERQKRIAERQSKRWNPNYYLQKYRYTSDIVEVVTAPHYRTVFTFENRYDTEQGCVVPVIVPTKEFVPEETVTKRINHRVVDIKPYVKRLYKPWKKRLKDDSHRRERRFYRNIKETDEDKPLLHKKNFGDAWEWD